MAEKLIAGGAWIQIQVAIDGVLYSIGMATGCSYDEDWNVQQAAVLNHLGPISLDSQGYTCSVTLNLFVPEKKMVLYADGGEITLEDLLPTRAEVQLDGKGRQYESLVFLNRATQKVIRSFSGVMLANNGEQISPNAYVTANMRFLAMRRDRTPAAA